MHVHRSKHRLIGLSAAATLLLFGVVACIKQNDLTVLGYAPVYGSAADLKNISSAPPQPIVHAGKIYQYQQYTFQIEQGEGIHVIESSKPSQAVKTAFIRVKGCSELSIRNNILYTDNHRDLVGIQISDIQQIKVVSRLPDVFPGTNQEYPPARDTYFECADPAKGMVIGWTEKLLTNPKCKR